MAQMFFFEEASKLNMHIEVIIFILVCWHRALTILIMYVHYFLRFFIKDILIISQDRVSPGICHTAIVQYGHIWLLLTCNDCYDFTCIITTGNFTHPAYVNVLNQRA